MLPEKKLTVLIVNFNSSEFIKTSLYALMNLTKNEFEVFIVDNGSNLSDYKSLKLFVEKYENFHLERFETAMRGSMAHGTALNHLVKKVKTPYFSILDADATWLKKGWDEILISKMDERVKVIGTQAPATKPQDFPLMFAILFETKTFNTLHIDFRPKDIAAKQDTGFELREKYLKAGFECINIKFFNTRTFKEGPFAKLVTSEFYLDGFGEIFASHFGRGSTLGVAKYKQGNISFLRKLPLIRTVLAKKLGQAEKQEWIRICREIIDQQVLEAIKQEEAVCDLCGNEHTDKLLGSRDYYNGLPGLFFAQRCQNCGLVFTSPRPTVESMSFYYPDSAGYFKPGKSKKVKGVRKEILDEILVKYFNYPKQKKKTALWLKLATPLFFRLKYTKLQMEGIPRFVQKGRLLDIGCSTGVYLARMRDRGWQVKGIEPNQAAARSGREHFGLDIENIDIKDFKSSQQFDVVTLRMVLEHVYSPQEVLETVNRVLVDDGELIINVPDFSGLEAKLFKRFAFTLQLPTHLFHFTPQTIRAYLRKNGFEVTRIVHHNTDRDLIAPLSYMREEGHSVGPLLKIVSNRFVRQVVIGFLVNVLALLGKTSRMTIYARKKAA